MVGNARGGRRDASESRSHAIGALAALALALAAAPAGAAAQTFTVLPVERDSNVSQAERLDAFQAVRGARVLGAGAIFEPVGEIEQRLGEQADLARCVEVDCAARLADAAHLDAVIVLAVWPGHDGRAANVAVSIVEPDGSIREADADVGDEGAASAATRALVAAARRRQIGEGVELRVTSVPDGALVRVDGTDVGVTPYLGAYERGAHVVEVSLHGRTERRDVELADDPQEVSVTLEGAASDGAHGSSNGAGHDAADAPTDPSPLNFILGGLLAAAGIIALTPPIVTLGQNGECTRLAPDGFCEQEAHFGAVSGVLLGVGLAALAAGAVVLIAQPFRVSVASDGTTGAMLTLTGSF